MSHLGLSIRIISFCVTNKVLQIVPREKITIPLFDKLHTYLQNKRSYDSFACPVSIYHTSKSAFFLEIVAQYNEVLDANWSLNNYI